jgi:hypothetical protein
MAKPPITKKKMMYEYTKNTMTSHHKAPQGSFLKRMT